MCVEVLELAQGKQRERRRQKRGTGFGHVSNRLRAKALAFPLSLLSLLSRFPSLFLFRCFVAFLFSLPLLLSLFLEQRSSSSSLFERERERERALLRGSKRENEESKERERRADACSLLLFFLFIILSAPLLPSPLRIRAHNRTRFPLSASRRDDSLDIEFLLFRDVVFSFSFSCFVFFPSLSPLLRHQLLTTTTTSPPLFQPNKTNSPKTKTNSPLRPEIARKLVAVDGDVSIPKSCGLSDADLAALRSSKKLVFVHSAASIYFTDHMHDLIRMNYGATRNVLELAEEVCGGGGKGKGEVNTSSQSSPPPPSSSSSSSSSPPLAALASRTSFSSSGLPPLARKASAVAPNGHTAQVLAHAGGAAAATTSNSSNSNNTTNSSSASPPPPPPLPSTPTLSAFVHVSTAYVNANRPTGSRVKEMVYSLVDERNAIDRRTRRRLGLVGCGEEEEEGKKRGDGGKSGGADGDGDGDGDGVSSSSSSSSSKTTALTIDHGVLMSSLLSIKDRAQAARVAQGVVDALGFPNAYTLSKNCCEKLVADWHEGRKNGSSSSSSSSSSISSSSSPLKGKIAIVRPTIIGPVGEGESRGYFGNGAGITSLVLAFATGVRKGWRWWGWRRSKGKN